MIGTITFTDVLTIQDLSGNAERLRDSLMLWDEVTVDMSCVCQVDIPAVQMLVAAQKECAASGKRLVLKLSALMADFIASVGIQL